jgi:hypothetical protein
MKEKRFGGRILGKMAFDPKEYWESESRLLGSDET